MGGIFYFKLNFDKKKSASISAKRGELGDLKETVPFASPKGEDQFSHTQKQHLNSKQLIPVDVLISYM
jgi:hypothetical protein